MKKDKTILELIERLKIALDFNIIEVIDFWDADLCAIGLKKENKLVYISTYNYLDQNIGRYDYDLEILDESEYNVLKEGRGVSEQELINKIRIFFEL